MSDLHVWSLSGQTNLESSGACGALSRDMKHAGAKASVDRLGKVASFSAQRTVWQEIPFPRLTPGVPQSH